MSEETLVNVNRWKPGQLSIQWNKFAMKYLVTLFATRGLMKMVVLYFRLARHTVGAFKPGRVNLLQEDHWKTHISTS